MTNKQVYCLGENTGCDHEDKPTLKECSDCPYMTGIKPKGNSSIPQVELDAIEFQQRQRDKGWT